MIVSAAISFEDWMDAYGTWGKIGVYRIFRFLKECGVRRVYWRTMGGGAVTYPSCFDDTIRKFWTDKSVQDGKWEEDNLVDGNIPESRIIDKIVDMREFDSVECARDAAKIFGIEFFLWHEVHQECHGHHQYSNFVREHPEFCPVNCYGEILPGHLSWGFPETIERRMNMLKEVLNYKPDGIYLDFVKGGDHSAPRIDGKGYSAIGYETPILDAYKEKTGIDATKIANDNMDWIRFRAEYVTEFVRQARDYQKKQYPDMVFGAFGVHKGRNMGAYMDEINDLSSIDTENPIASSEVEKLRKREMVTVGMAGPLEGNLEDHETWTREGLLDSLVADIFPLLPSREYGGRIDHARSLIKGGCSFGTDLNTWAANSEQIIQMAKVAKEHNCDEIVCWEFIGVINNKTIEAVKQAAEEYCE